MQDFNLIPEDIVRSSEVLDNEIHYRSGCKCKRRRLHHDGEFYYLYYRICVCGEYLNRLSPFEHTAENRRLPIGHINIDGVDIHGNAHCHYKYLKSQPSGNKVFRLICYCDK